MMYRRLWDDAGYGKRWAKVMALRVDEGRKQAALMRVWHRMVRMETQ
jgi:hypothetical protein